MVRCARCLQQGSIRPLACPSCAWRALRRDLDLTAEPHGDVAAWEAFYDRIQGGDDSLRRLRLFALLLGENGARTPEIRDADAYRAELLRLAEKMLRRIDEF